MSQIKNMSALAVVILAGMSGPAFADTATRFDRLDQDGNGRITDSEILAHRTARFEAADVDGDGVLTRKELRARSEAAMDARIDRLLGRHDRDGDGALSRAEMSRPERGARRFERLDKDADGAISRGEFKAARAHGAGRHAGRGGE